MNVTMQLRRTIEDSEESRYAISKATGVSEAVLSRFVRGHTQISGENIDRLCSHLGLELRPARTGRMKGS